MTPRRYPHQNSGTDETLIGKRVFADRMKLMILRGGDNSRLFNWALCPMDKHPYEREAVEKEQKRCRPTEGKAV